MLISFNLKEAEAKKGRKKNLDSNSEESKEDKFGLHGYRFDPRRPVGHANPEHRRPFPNRRPHSDEFDFDAGFNSGSHESRENRRPHKSKPGKGNHGPPPRPGNGHHGPRPKPGDGHHGPHPNKPCTKPTQAPLPESTPVSQPSPTTPDPIPTTEGQADPTTPGQPEPAPTTEGPQPQTTSEPDFDETTPTPP